METTTLLVEWANIRKGWRRLCFESIAHASPSCPAALRSSQIHPPAASKFHGPLHPCSRLYEPSSRAYRVQTPASCSLQATSFSKVKPASGSHFQAHLPLNFRKLLVLQLKKLTASGKLMKVKFLQATRPSLFPHLSLSLCRKSRPGAQATTFFLTAHRASPSLGCFWHSFGVILTPWIEPSTAPTSNGFRFPSTPICNDWPGFGSISITLDYSAPCSKKGSWLPSANSCFQLWFLSPRPRRRGPTEAWYPAPCSPVMLGGHLQRAGQKLQKHLMATQQLPLALGSLLRPAIIYLIGNLPSRRFTVIKLISNLKLKNTCCPSGLLFYGRKHGGRPEQGHQHLYSIHLDSLGGRPPADRSTQISRGKQGCYKR